jgi:hypothetical protein
MKELNIAAELEKIENELAEIDEEQEEQRYKNLALGLILRELVSDLILHHHYNPTVLIKNLNEMSQIVGNPKLAGALKPHLDVFQKGYEMIQNEEVVSGK